MEGGKDNCFILEHRDPKEVKGDLLYPDERFRRLLLLIDGQPPNNDPSPWAEMDLGDRRFPVHSLSDFFCDKTFKLGRQKNIFEEKIDGGPEQKGREDAVNDFSGACHVPYYIGVV